MQAAWAIQAYPFALPKNSMNKTGNSMKRIDSLYLAAAGFAHAASTSNIQTAERQSISIGDTGWDAGLSRPRRCWASQVLQPPQ